MRYRVVGSDGRVLSVEAVDWMMAMCHVINHLDIEVSGWMCDNRPNGEVHVADPVHGHAWVVCPADRPMPARPQAPVAEPSVLSGPPSVPPAISTLPPAPRTAPSPPPAPPERTPPPTPAARTLPPAPPAPPAPPRPSQVQTLLLEPEQQHEPRWKERSTPPGSLNVARHLQGVEPKRLSPEDAPPSDLAERLFDLSFDVSGASSANDACRRALDVALQLVPCEAGSVARGGINDDSLTFVAASGPAGNQIIGKKVRYGEGIVGVAFDLGITVLVTDASADPRHMSDMDKATGFKTRGILCVPVRTETEFFGAIELLNPPRGFQSWHVEVVETVSRTLSSTLAGIS
ncbi:MAG: GAF domain-containing protein [Deltaproteobacteria bacterium]|nr:GAF domain-containing protein [Deltaproteobacteria bacterium]